MNLVVVFVTPFLVVRPGVTKPTPKTPPKRAHLKYVKVISISLQLKLQFDAELNVLLKPLFEIRIPRSFRASNFLKIFRIRFRWL